MIISTIEEYAEKHDKDLEEVVELAKSILDDFSEQLQVERLYRSNSRSEAKYGRLLKASQEIIDDYQDINYPNRKIERYEKLKKAIEDITNEKIELKGEKEMAKCYFCGERVKAKSRKMPLCDRCKDHCDTDDIRRAENGEFKTGN